METETKRFYQKPWIRILAGLLALTLVFTLLSRAWIRVEIVPDTDNAAQTYLAEDTPYVNASDAQRLKQRLYTLRTPVVLEDYYSRAGMAIAAQDYAGALTYIEQCLELFTPEYGRELHTDLLIKQGCLLAMLGRDAEAEAPLETALEMDSSQSDVYLVLAQIYARGEQTQKLTQVLSDYLDQEPEDAAMRLLLAQLLYAAADYTQAASHTIALLESEELEQTELYGLCSGLGLMLTQNSQFSQALTLLDSAIAMAESSSDPTLLTTSAQQIQAGSTPDQDMALLCYYRGLCNLTLEYYEEAAQDYTRAIDQQILPQLSHYGRGVAELMTQEPDYQLALEDLVFAADFQGQEADATVSAQARDMVALLTQQP